MQRISYESSRCCDVAVAFLAIRNTPYVRRKPISKCVRVELSLKLKGLIIVINISISMYALANQKIYFYLSAKTLVYTKLMT